MSGPKHTPLSGPCPSCEGRGYDYESGDWPMGQPIKVACPDCAGTGKAENSITANEKLREAAPRLAEALERLLGLVDELHPNGFPEGFWPYEAVAAARVALREAGASIPPTVES